MFKLIKKAVLFLIITSVLVVVLYKFVPVPYTPLMLSRSLEYKDTDPELVQTHDWVPIENISKNLQKAVICSEDAKFLVHNGFDFSAMQKAFEGNLRGKKLKGGSTISQQTAKNVFLWQGRSYIRKVLEAYFTVLIEVIWGKERILEVYLNSIEMGKGVYGAEAACQFWYQKECKSLTKIQAAGIAAILPNPRRYKAVQSSNYIQRRKNKIINAMNRTTTIKFK